MNYNRRCPFTVCMHNWYRLVRPFFVHGGMDGHRFIKCHPATIVSPFSPIILIDDHNLNKWSNRVLWRSWTVKRPPSTPSTLSCPKATKLWKINNNRERYFSNVQIGGKVWRYFTISIIFSVGNFIKILYHVENTGWDIKLLAILKNLKELQIFTYTHNCLSSFYFTNQRVISLNNYDTVSWQHVTNNNYVIRTRKPIQNRTNSPTVEKTSNSGVVRTVLFETSSFLSGKGDRCVEEAQFKLKVRFPFSNIDVTERWYFNGWRWPRLA